MKKAKYFLKKVLTIPFPSAIIAYVLRRTYAGVAELADALDSGSNGRKAVQVQVLLPAPTKPRERNVFEAFLFSLRKK